MKKLILPLALIFVFHSSQLVAQQDTNIIQTKAGKIRMEKLTSLSEPWGMAWLPDGRLLVTEKPGRLRIYSAGNLSAPVGGLPKIDYKDQGGLLDVEVDPNFASNSFVYIYFSEAAEVQPKLTRDPGDPRFGTYQDHTDVTLKGGAVARGRLEGNELKDVTVIWRQVPKTIGRGHFGGRIVFSPDGKLFITSGDRQRFEPAQSLTNNLGKIVRINPDGSIPGDNPYVKRPGARPDIWSIGHRNPLGALIHDSTKQLWIHEMGPAGGDEINIPVAGKNYGWPTVSNGDNYDGSRIPDHETRSEFVKPLTYWFPAISPSGFMQYNGSMFPKWKNNIFLGTFNSEGLVKLTIQKGKVASEERIWLRKRVRDMIQAPDGSIWIITDYKDGALIRLSATDN